MSKVPLKSRAGVSAAQPSHPHADISVSPVVISSYSPRCAEHWTPCDKLSAEVMQRWQRCLPQATNAEGHRSCVPPPGVYARPRQGDLHEAHASGRTPQRLPEVGCALQVGFGSGENSLIGEGPDVSRVEAICNGCPLIASETVPASTLSLTSNVSSQAVSVVVESSLQACRHHRAAHDGTVLCWCTLQTENVQRTMYCVYAGFVKAWPMSLSCVVRWCQAGKGLRALEIGCGRFSTTSPRLR